MDLSILIPLRVGYGKVNFSTLDGLKVQPYIMPLWVIEDGTGPFGFFSIGLGSDYWMGLN